MPIRVNLLAEAQALEEEKRRDPVKRAALAGLVVIALVLFWSGLLLMNTWAERSTLSRFEGDLNSKSNSVRQILENQKKLTDTKQKLDALHMLSTNRFLNGNLLDVLQKNTLDNVQLVRIKVAQTYTLIDEAKKAAAAEGNAETSAKKAPPKPAKATEKIIVTLEGRDNSTTPGDAVTRFQNLLSSTAYFQENLGKTNIVRLTSYGMPQTDPDGKTFVLFTLEARFPEKTR